MNTRYWLGIFLVMLIASVASVSAFTLGTGSLQNVCATQTALFVIPVTNDGNEVEEYTVSLSGNAAKWAVAAPSGFILNPGETKSVYIYATPAAGSLPGNYELKTTITSSLGASEVVLNTLEVENCHRANIVASADSLESCAGLPVQFSLTLTNEGSFSEAFDLSLSGDGANIASLSDSVVNLDSGESKELLVNAKTDHTGSYGITVASQSRNTGVIAVEKLLYEAKGCYDFDIMPDKNYFSFCENTEVKIPITIENKGTLSNTYNLVTDGPKWATMENTEITVPSGGSQVANLVLFPGYGVEGDFKVKVQAVGDEGGISSYKEVVANVLECHKTSLEIPTGEDVVCPFTQESYEVSLANLGEYAEHYAVTVSGADWASVSDELIDIENGDSEKFTLDISPKNIDPGQYVLKVSAESQDSCHSSNSDIIAVKVASKDSCFGVSLDAQYDSVGVVYGEGALVPVVVENKGTQESIYNLEVSGTGASYAQLNPTTITLDGGESETVYLYISMPEHTPKNVYSMTVSARLEDGTLSDSDVVEVKLITPEVDPDAIKKLFDEEPEPEPEAQEEEPKEGVTTKVRGIVGGIIGVGSSGASKAASLLMAKTTGFSNWMILIGLIVLLGLVVLAWKVIGELDTPPAPVQQPKEEKKGLWQRFIDFLEEDDDEWNLDGDKEDKKKNNKKKK